MQAWYAGEGVPEVGTRLAAEILKSTQRLIDYPDSGRKVPEFEQSHIREIIHPPFRVIYLREEHVVSVIRVWRSERMLALPGDDA